MDLDLKINDFEGPLDLLIHLIKESKMDIFDIQIEEITNQYLAYLDKQEKLNLEIASEYLVLASELIEIKSKMLLPNEKIENGVEEDPREELVNRIIEYESYKEITKKLREQEEFRHEIYTKAPSDIKSYIGSDTTIETEICLDDLLEAFKRFLDRQKMNRPISTQVTSKEITVSSRREDIRLLLKSKKKVTFFELFPVVTKEYVVATFLAILEMAKSKELIISQEHRFSEIICEVNSH